VAAFAIDRSVGPVQVQPTPRRSAMNIRLLVPLLLLVSPLALAQAPNDAQIAQIVLTANQVDLDAGKLAETKASNADVKAFAREMVKDHTSVNNQAKALAKKLGVKPQPSDTSKSLAQGGKENLTKLKGMKKGEAFDKAYIDHEVAYHQAVIDAMDKTLIPDAKNAELKELLVKSRPVFIAHLDHAKTIQDKLGK
jgi:putative membrane protein